MFTLGKYIHMIPYYGMDFNPLRWFIYHLTNNSRALLRFLSMIIWNEFSIPKCCFTFWLNLKNRLISKDMIFRFGMCTNPLCVLCKSRYKSVQNLISNCPYFDMIDRECPVTINNNWARCQTRDKFVVTPKILLEMASLYLTVAIYNIWKERILRMHNSTANHVFMTLIHNIK